MEEKEDEDIPLKIIELEDFLRYPSIISKQIQLKQTKHQLEKSSRSNLVLFKHKSYSIEEQNELIIPKDIIVFADEIDRKKFGLFNKSSNQFSRHLLITSADALQALIPSLINAKQWIIFSKLKYFKRFTKQIPIQGNVVMSLNLNHPLVRYEIVTAFDLLQQAFNEMKSAYIVIDFQRILSRWFKNYLKRIDEYPSLSHRLLYRYQMQTNKCLISLGKRNSLQNQRSDMPMEIYIDFNCLSTRVYSIELNNLFTYSMNQKSKQIFKNIGDGLALISVQNIDKNQDEIVKPTKPIDQLVPKQDLIVEQNPSCPPKEPLRYSSSFSSYIEPSEHDHMLFDQISNNRMRIQMQHQQLMLRAAKLLSYSSINSDSTMKRNGEISY